MPVIIEKPIVAVFNAANKLDLIKQLEEYLLEIKPTGLLAEPVVGPINWEKVRPFMDDPEIPLLMNDKQFDEWLAPLIGKKKPDTIAKVREAFNEIALYLVVRPAHLKVLAKEHAAKTNCYGVPVELIEEYLYLHWMLGMYWPMYDELQKINKLLRIERASELIADEFDYKCFEEPVHQLAVRFCKEFGWRGPKTSDAYNDLKGTNFNRLEKSCSELNIYGWIPPTPRWCTLNAWKLYNAIHGLDD
jgi:hypothetical protein